MNRHTSSRSSILAVADWLLHTKMTTHTIADDEKQIDAIIMVYIEKGSLQSHQAIYTLKKMPRVKSA